MPHVKEFAEGKGGQERGRKPVEPVRDHNETILELQRQAGNAAVTQLIQVMREATSPGGDGLPGPAEPGNLAAQIRRAAAGGGPLPGSVRDRLEHGLGADLSGVRVHNDAGADRLSRSVAADAFTTGNDLFFRSGAYAPYSQSGFKVLAHEATHVVQQRQGAVAATPAGGGIALSHPSDSFERAADQTATKLAAGTDVAPSAPVQRTAAPGAGQDLCIQRHSSWEHMLIGDLKPEELGTLGAAYDAADGLPGQKFDVGNKKVTSDDVAHVIEQEIRRLQYFQKSPPTGGVANLRQAEHKLKKTDTDDRVDKALKTDGMVAALKAVNDPKWDVRLVSIPSQNTSFMVTYGELNTMADFFGGVGEMSAMDSKFLDRLIRGVRQSTMNELIKIYAKIKGVKEKKAKKQLGVKSANFKSATGKNNAIAMGGVMNELKLMGALGPIGKAKPRVGSKSTTYSSTLGRNACHFAPESWHSYADHHDRALAKAHAAHQASLAHNDVQAANDANEALLINGFGDHYLQDSYAAGHLINKTQIMGFYTKYLDKSHLSADFHKNENWRKAQDMAYGQSGLTDAGQYNKAGVGQQRNIRGQQVGSARNPQAVANINTNDKLVKAEALGLVVPPSVQQGTDSYTVLTTWQAATLDQWRKHGPRSVKEIAKLVAAKGLTLAQTKQAIEDLVSDGVVRRDSFSVKQRAAAAGLKDSDQVVLREAYIPKNSVNFMQSMQNPQAYQDMALGVQYSEYLEYMNSSFLQKATNALHNKFCEEGLEVSSHGGGPGGALFKIYGDDAMFKKGASAGLLESGETAHRSREGIEHTIEHGLPALPPQLSTAALVDRLPAYVSDASSGGNHISLADWHNLGSLRTFCENTVFPGMLGGAGVITNKLAPGVLSKDLGKIDQRPDKNEVF